jgi:hypothetical protein
LRTGKPVISNHLENEQRFRTPELLFEHGIRRAMNVIVQGDGSPYGVLEVDSRSEGEFGQNDIAFLQGAANILGMAIEQQQYQRKLQAALDRYQVLLREVNHRVKNSLQMVSSMLHLQANAVGDQNLSERLNEAASRVNAVGRAYERLAYTADYENIDLIEYLRQIIHDLVPTVAPSKIQFDAPEAIRFARIVRFLSGSSSMNSSQMLGSMLIQIVPAARSGCGFKRKTTRLRFRSATKASVFLLVLTQPRASGWAHAWSTRLQSNWAAN